MERMATVRWVSPPPTSVDEELAVYDDGSAWLVIRAPRDGGPAIGTWSAAVDEAAAEAAAQLGDVVVDLLNPEPAPAVAERLRAAALEQPVAVARFYADASGLPSVSLAVVGDGTRAVQFELAADALALHLDRDGATVAWSEAPPPVTGFITPDADGLGGLRTRAVVEPGAFGVVLLDATSLPAAAGDTIAVEVRGQLAEGLPDAPRPASFRVRTGPAAVIG